MSRAYRVAVECKGLKNEEQLSKIMVGKFGWEELECGFDSKTKVYDFVGEGTLYGGQSEEEAHEQIVTELRKLNKKAHVKTTWTYLEDLPNTSYGSLE